jgi:hypothetical protein
MVMQSLEPISYGGSSVAGVFGLVLLISPALEARPKLLQDSTDYSIIET